MFFHPAKQGAAGDTKLCRRTGTMPVRRLQCIDNLFFFNCFYGMGKIIGLVFKRHGSLEMIRLDWLDGHI